MKKTFSGIFTFVLCFILLFVFASCAKSTNNNNSNQVTSSVTTTKDVYYTITFKNDDGTILQSAELKEGTTPSYDGTPTKENTAEYTYTFSGWNPSIEAVTKDMVYTATYTATVNSYTITLNTDNDVSGTVTGAGTYNYGKEITIKATPNQGYTFVGWYDGENEVSTEASYTFNMPGKDIVYKSKFSANTNTKYKVEHYLQNIDDDNYPDTPEYVDNLTGTTDTLTNAEAKTYEGFKAPTITQENINGDESTVIKLYYERNSYSVILTKDNGGSVTGARSYKYGDIITLEATPDSGYTFVGWYYLGQQVSTNKKYSHEMGASNFEIHAKFSANTNTKYKVEHYLQNLDDDNYPETPEYVDNKTGTTDTLTNAEAKTYEGFTAPTITQENINGDESTVIKLYYTINSYALTLKVSDNNAGSVTGAGTYKYGRTVTITASPNQGYSFIGWYDGENEVSTEAKFDYEIESSNATLEARYSISKYTITINNQVSNVTISGITSGNEYEYKSSIIITANNNSNFSLGWKVNGETVFVGDEYTFVMPAYDLNITIYYKEYKRVNNKIYFGSYPQTKVTDNELIAELNTKAGDLPTSTDLGSWTDYNYYISSKVTSFMYYQDIDYDNNGTYDYRGVYFTQYRPNYYSDSSSTSHSYQDDNRYATNTIYWFSYDPIEWNILEEKDGKALIIANLVLDAQNYYKEYYSYVFVHNGGEGYANNYKLSNIRMFLNDNFYNTVFNELQKQIIEITQVNNGAFTTSSESNIYAKNLGYTYDKVFLLSYKEITNYYKTNSDRMVKCTDYARCQGAFKEDNTGTSYLGNVNWWLRSPSEQYAQHSSVITYDGYIKSKAVGETYIGVRPACWITL